MRKRDELSHPESCLNRAHEDELLFVLRGHDAATPATIRYWARKRIALKKNHHGDPQIAEALDCAERMERERGSRGKTLAEIFAPEEERGR